MSDESGWTPEQHLLAAFDHLGRAVRTWATDTRRALEPVIGRLGELLGDPDAKAARVRRRAEEDVALACDCDCAEVHPGSWVCEVKGVTTIRRPGPGGPVDIPVCAPCAVEMMAQQL